MERIDRGRFDAAHFPITFDVHTRFADLDMQGHVNNAASVELLQEARAHFNVSAGLFRLYDGLRPMIAAFHVEYAREIHHPALVVVGNGTVAIGRSSVTIGQVARVGGIARLYARAVMVFVGDGGPAAIPEPLRAAYGKLAIV